jgi:AraC family L-rhamnose operon regulatory protein RhaS
MSKRFYITKNLDVLEFEAKEEWGYPKHKHLFFELTFIISGSGKHHLNNHIISYKTGDVFFLTPKDEHEFVIEEPTVFGIIKFTEHLFLEKTNMSSSTIWRKNLDTVIFYANIIPESIIAYEEDRLQLFRLYELIKDELKHGFIFGREVLIELFGALLVIVSRNLKHETKDVILLKASNKEKIENILTYIRQHILDKELLKIKTLAETFYMSPNYISIYIKKHTGISLQTYILKNKIEVAERLLQQTPLNISEIAEKTGFIDSSHFNRMFKKYTGKNPSQCR